MRVGRRCRRDASEEYYGHVGAVRCMVEGGGDVAFVRHTAPAEVSAGRRREWWARDLLPDDLQLLCPDGMRIVYVYVDISHTHTYTHTHTRTHAGTHVHTEKLRISNINV